MKEESWDKAFYGVDCMDAEIGLPSYPDNYFELGYTDPEWGVQYSRKFSRGGLYSGRILKPKEGLEHYEDKFDSEFIFSWLDELKRICKGIIILTGEKNKFWWIQHTNPKDELIIHLRNGFAKSPIAWTSRKSTYLFYGEFRNRLKCNVINYTLPWGFLSKEKYLHPSPKGTELALKILFQLKPESLIDPFAGSGSFLKAADILGIKWIGYEINKVYKQDFDKRFSQKSILNY